MYIKEIEKPRLGFSCLVLISQFRNHHAERTNFARGSQCFDITKESSVCWRETATKSYLTALSAIFCKAALSAIFSKYRGKPWNLSLASVHSGAFCALL